MKLIAKFTFVLVFSSIITGYSQNNSEKEKRKTSELKINTISLLAFGALDFSYEYIFNEESSLGLSLYYTEPKEPNIEVNKSFSITPYYRIYFSNKYNKGFFLETFASYTEGKEYIYSSYYDNDNYYSDTTLLDYSGASLGITAGGKWVTKRGFIAEISLGVGRYITGGPIDLPILVRGGISLGKRF